jgi:beta-galactosidase
MRFEDAPCSGPCFFQAEMNVKKPSDTFLDARGLHKGEMWVGQHMLGRFWSVGPQYALYTPAEWLSKGNNVVTIFDGLSDGSAVVKTSTEPIFGATMLGRD